MGQSPLEVLLRRITSRAGHSEVLDPRYANHPTSKELAFAAISSDDSGCIYCNGNKPVKI